MGYSLEIVLLLVIISFIIGCLVTLGYVFITSARITKKERKSFDLYLSEKKSRLDQLNKEAKELKNNY